jgi:hypothetical protein
MSPSREEPRTRDRRAEVLKLQYDDFGDTFEATLEATLEPDEPARSDKSKPREGLNKLRSQVQCWAARARASALPECLSECACR